MTVADRPLARELSTFEAHRSELFAQNPGKYVLVKADRIVGVFDTEADALRAGYAEFGIESFLVRRILAVDEEIRLSAFLTGRTWVASRGRRTIRPDMQGST